MPINFLEVACTTTSTNKIFGLCDNPAPAKDPAFIDEADSSKWIATVNNPRQIKATFQAVDRCITVKKANGDDESRCDGILLHDSSISFFELKDRASGRWLGAGIVQLTITHSLFKANHDMTQYTQIEAYVANKQKPIFHVSQKMAIQQFKNNTGITLKVQSTIDI